MLGQSCTDPQILTDSSEKLQINLNNREIVPKARICSCILSDSVNQGKMICRRGGEDHQHGGGTELREGAREEGRERERKGGRGRGNVNHTIPGIQYKLRHVTYIYLESRIKLVWSGWLTPITLTFRRQR